MSADPGHQTSWEKLIYLLNFLSSTGGKYGENLYSQSHSKPSSERYVSPKSLLRQKIFQPEKEVSRGLFGGRLLQREQVLQIWHKQGWCFVRWPFHTSKPIYLQPIKENELWKPPFLWQYGVHWSDSPTDFKEWVGEPDKVCTCTPGYKTNSYTLYKMIIFDLFSWVFVQLVWKDSRKIGVGLAEVPQPRLGPRYQKVDIWMKMMFLQIK